MLYYVPLQVTSDWQFLGLPEVLAPIISDRFACASPPTDRADVSIFVTATSVGSPKMQKKYLSIQPYIEYSVSNRQERERGSATKTRVLLLPIQ